MKDEKTELEKRVIANAKESDKKLIEEIQQKGMESNSNLRTLGEIPKSLKLELKKPSIDIFNSLDSLVEYSKMFFESSLVKFANIEQVTTVILQGKELGLSPLVSLFNIHYISGKPTLGVHAQNALLKRSGIASVTVEEWEYIDSKGGVTKDRTEAKDFRTSIEFRRKSELFDVLKERGQFSFKDAEKAGLTDKDNWKNYPKIMVWNRAFSIGARRIAPDVLLGCMEFTEMADTIDLPYTVTENNEIIIQES